MNLSESLKISLLNATYKNFPNHKICNKFSEFAQYNLNSDSKIDLPVPPCHFKILVSLLWFQHVQFIQGDELVFDLLKMINGTGLRNKEHSQMGFPLFFNTQLLSNEIRVDIRFLYK